MWHRHSKRRQHTAKDSKVGLRYQKKGYRLAVVAFVVSSVLVVGGWFLPRILDRTKPRGGPPLQVVTEYDPQFVEDWLIPENITEVVRGVPVPPYPDGGNLGPDGQPGTEDDETCNGPQRVRWLQSKRSVVAGQVTVPVIVTANLDSTVLLEGIDVVMLERGPGVPGTTVALCPGAGPVEIWRAAVDLDAPIPKVMFQEPDTGESEQLRLPLFEIRAGATEGFAITATTRRGFVRFVLRMRFRVNNQEQSMQVDDHGRAFEVAACTGRSLYLDNMFSDPSKATEAFAGGGPCGALVE